MVLGSTLLTVAFLERLACVLRGQTFEVGDGDEKFE